MASYLNSLLCFCLSILIHCVAYQSLFVLRLYLQWTAIMTSLAKPFLTLLLLFHVMMLMLFLSHILNKTCRQDWAYYLTLRRNPPCLTKAFHGRAQMSRYKTFFAIWEIFGLRKDYWIVDYFRLSWNLSVDLWIKPGFEIAFSIWQTFKSDLSIRYWF